MKVKKYRTLLLGIVIIVFVIAVITIIIVNVIQRDGQPCKLYELSGYEDVFSEQIVEIKATAPIDNTESVFFSDADLVEELEDFLSEINLKKYNKSLPLVAGGGYTLTISYKSGNVVLSFRTYEDIGNILTVDGVNYLYDGDTGEIWNDMYETARERNGYVEVQFD